VERTEARLWELLDSIVDGSYTDQEQKEFSRLLDENRNLTPGLVEQLRIHSLLQWQWDAVRSGPMPGNASRPAISKREGEKDESAGRKAVKLPPRRWRWAAAAIFALGAAGAAWYTAGRLFGARQAVAEIVDEHPVDWTANTTALVEGGGVIPGRLEMRSGKLTLRFRSGATVVATGDVSMLIESDMRVRLERGQATAQVPEWARGFTIKTADVEIVDLGTKFGVVARDNIAGGSGATDVVVFQGQVDLKPTSSPANNQRRLSQGEGVRVSNEGAVDRIFEVRSDAAGEDWTTDEPDQDDMTTFKSIRDNIPSSDVPTYYQITPRGLQDDCRAYVDAPHEWNGLTADGLPEFLRQADYVRTFNDYRYINELEITVELLRPAVVYVFFDHRVPPPDWLTSQFENTGVDIGLDEGAWFRGDKAHTTAVGGGQSIDNVFSVWQRRCDTPQTLKLGAMGTKPGARAMYGIAGKPLD
jgi:hypothetical protein